jgi:hypothetical protein
MKDNPTGRKISAISAQISLEQGMLRLESELRKCFFKKSASQFNPLFALPIIQEAVYEVNKNVLVLMHRKIKQMHFYLAFETSSPIWSMHET